MKFYLPGYVQMGFGASIRRVGTSIKGKFTDTNDQVIDPYVMVRPEVIAALGKLARQRREPGSAGQCGAGPRHPARAGRSLRPD